MDMKIVGVSVAVLVSLVVLAGVLMPILDDATATEKTFSNEGLYYITEFGENEITYTFDGSTWTINGDTSNIDPTSDITVVAGDGVIVRANGNVPGIASPKTITSLVVSSSGLTMDYTKADDSTATYSATIDMYYCAINGTSGYTLSQGTPVYVHGDSAVVSEIFLGVASGLGSIFLIDGNINDGFTVTAQREGVTVSNIVCNYEEVDGYNDLYKITGITFTSTYNDTVRNQSCATYVTPASVTSELSEHLTMQQIALLAVIPVMVILAILVAVVAVVAGRLFN